MKPIGIIHSCFKKKFCIPRQPGLVKSATATIELLSPYNVEEALRGIEDYSHLWIVFVFHKSKRNEFHPTVRPPRLGGNKRIGVFASRSPFRPNPIGLSVVELKEIKGTTIEITGGDFLDKTPVLDIKPYIPYVDAIEGANGAFAHLPPKPTNTVEILAEAKEAFCSLEEHKQNVIKDMLSYNVRPAYQKNDPTRIYGTQIFDIQIKWQQNNSIITIVEII